MAKQKIRGLSPSLLEQPSPDASVAAPPMPETADRPVVQTVKVPPDLFVRLKTIGARERRSSQDIILSALREYLDRFPDA
jgi:hypothetical protein